MNRSSLPLGVNKLKKWWDDENRVLRCDLPFQRHAGAWSPITKSNLVWSILADSYIPPIVLLKDKSGVDERGKDTFLYNIEDGQQRLTNLFSFMDDGWTLHGATPVVEYDGFEYDLAGKKFSELPEELQSAISQYRFSVQCLENYTMQEAESLFFNINSGVALSAVQKSKAKMGTDLIQFFSGLLEGVFFTQAIHITEAQARREDDLLMLLQSALLLDNRHDGLEYKTISAAYCLAYAESIKGSYTEEKREILREAVRFLDTAFPAKNKFLRKNNVPVVAVMARVAQEQGVTPDSFRGFINDFASQEHPAYDEASGSGNVKARSVQMRLRMMFLAFCGYFGLEAGAVGKPFADTVPLDEGTQAAEPGEAAGSSEDAIPAAAEGGDGAGTALDDGTPCADVG